MILISIYSLLFSYEIFFFKKTKTCHENKNIFGTIYKYVKQYISYIEIDYKFIPKIHFIEHLQISFILLLIINLFVLIPLLYLVIIHTSNCKKKRKEKSLKKINIKIENINPDELLENSEHETSSDS